MKKKRDYGSKRNDHLFTSPPDDLARLPGGLEISRYGTVVKWSFSQNCDPKALAEHFIQAGKQAECDLEKLADELLSELQHVDPISLIGQVLFFITVSPNLANNMAFFSTQDALLEYICGLALSINSLVKIPASPERAFKVFNSLLSVKELAESVYMGKKFSERSSEDPLDEVRFLLGLEGLFDRMEGYVPHLRRIYEAIFEPPLSAVCIDKLGFSPGCIPDLVDAIVQRRRSAFHKIANKARNTTGLRSAGVPNRPERTEGLSPSISYLLEEYCNLAAREPLGYLSEAIGISTAQIKNLLEALSSPWGSQPHYRLPSQENRFTCYPVLRRGQEFFVPLPWQILHQGLHWFDDYLSKCGFAELRAKWLKARDQATERIVREQLERVFGTRRVLSPVEYRTNDEWAEADALVLVSPFAIIVESKAHSLTASGRRGAPARIKKKAEELLQQPTQQAERLSRYLLEGGREFRKASDQQPIDMPIASSAIDVIVSFERIDPLSHTVANLLADTCPGEVWSVCLADFLMVSEILPSPPEFFAYVKARSAVATDPSLRSFMEADLLGAFLNDRLAHLFQLREQKDAVVTLNYSADELDAYFADIEFGPRANPPSTRVPRPVLAALERLMEDPDLRIPMKTTTCSGHAVHLTERSDASEIIIPSTGRHGQGRIGLAP